MSLHLSQVPLVMAEDIGKGGQQKETSINVERRGRMGEERGKKASKKKDQSANPNGLVKTWFQGQCSQILPLLLVILFCLLIMTLFQEFR